MEKKSQAAGKLFHKEAETEMSLLSEEYCHSDSLLYGENFFKSPVSTEVDEVKPV